MADIVELQAVINVLQGHARDLSGMREAPANTLDKAPALPFTRTIPGAGALKLTTVGFATGIHTLVTEMRMNYNRINANERQVLEYVRAFAKLVLNDPTLGGTVDHVQGMRYEFGDLPYGDTEAFGLRWEIDVKMQGTTA